MAETDMKHIKSCNIILVGMPGAGKSTIGPALAERLGLQFLDTDDKVAELAGMGLKDYVAQYGKESFLDIQEKAIFGLQLTGYVIATGGSAGCSQRIMEFFKKHGYAVYLKLDYSFVEKRLAPGRKLVRNGGKSLKELYDERVPLYEAYSDFTVECTNRDVDSIVNEIISEINHGI